MCGAPDHKEGKSVEMSDAMIQTRENRHLFHNYQLESEQSLFLAEMNPGLHKLFAPSDVMPKHPSLEIMFLWYRGICKKKKRDRNQS